MDGRAEVGAVGGAPTDGRGCSACGSGGVRLILQARHPPCACCTAVKSSLAPLKLRVQVCRRLPRFFTRTIGCLEACDAL
eukprot:1015018-Amphidinium_carterae.2